MNDEVDLDSALQYLAATIDAPSPPTPDYALEFRNRLKHCLDRQLIGANALVLVAKAETPFNPLDREEANLHGLAHSQAFDTLLQRLDATSWLRVRAFASDLSITHTMQVRSRAGAIRDTAPIFAPRLTGSMPIGQNNRTALVECVTTSNFQSALVVAACGLDVVVYAHRADDHFIPVWNARVAGEVSSLSAIDAEQAVLGVIVLSGGDVYVFEASAETTPPFRKVPGIDLAYGRVGLAACRLGVFGAVATKHGHVRMFSVSDPLNTTHSESIGAGLREPRLVAVGGGVVGVAGSRDGMLHTFEVVRRLADDPAS